LTLSTRLANLFSRFTLRRILLYRSTIEQRFLRSTYCFEMKQKLVFWAEEAVAEGMQKCLLAMELKAEDNRLELHKFEGEAATETLEKELKEKWMQDLVVAFPTTGYQKTAQELSAASRLLPEAYNCLDNNLNLEGLKTEWLFAVLSTKLYKTYWSELGEIQDRVERATKYDKMLWEELKAFQAKVHAQDKEKNLFREHVQELRDSLNELFGLMKNLRKVQDEAFEQAAKANYDQLDQGLSAIEKELEGENGKWDKYFEQLKGLQAQMKKMKLSKKQRNSIWGRIDQAFKLVKVKRFGKQNGDSRLERRIQGLEEAIKKMQRSIDRDQKELDIQDQKINAPNATQIETQLREVKAKMLTERISSKAEKLADMNKTMTELQKRLAKMQKQAAELQKETEAQTETPPVVVETPQTEEPTENNGEEDNA